MKYQPLDSTLYVENRKKFVSHLKPNSVAVFNSNDIMPTNADGVFDFRQNNDLFYLSGIDQEESILLLSPDFPDPKHREILFVKRTDEHIAIWEGHKYTKEEARETSGIKTIYWLDQFDSVFNSVVLRAENIYLNTNEHSRAVIEVENRDRRFITWCREKYPLHIYQRSAPILQKLRPIKSGPEIEALKTACDITEKGFRRVLEFVKPGVMEYEIEAEYAHEFLRNRSRGFGYTPIIASGANACVLHYIDNNKVCNDGDLLLMDVGAEYGNYNADMTRCIPVNGKFTPRQKEVYNAVLRVKREAVQLLTPGNTIPEYHKEVGKVMEMELIGLGLLDRKEVANQNPDTPLYKKYFMHGTSHHLGLDVHDINDTYDKMKPGMVFTVEPGIYIRNEELGIRIENNVVIRDEGVVDLMSTIPVEVEEIEELMNT
ncbi:MAG: aminopeptidase P family protein [Bacteroidota bacterium]